MILSINQPAYLPWLGYFERIARSDMHVVLDHVQFEKNSFTNRNRIRTRGGPLWLTIPLATKGQFGNLPICGLEFATSRSWQRKHWATLKMSYSRAPCFASLHGAYEEIYTREWDCFITFIRALLNQHLLDLGIITPVIFSSELLTVGSKSDLILDICRKLEAKTYLSGSQGRAYLNRQSFHDEGISIEYQEYRHPVYRQAWPGFESHLGILDLLFNYGKDSLQVLMNNS